MGLSQRMTPISAGRDPRSSSSHLGYDEAMEGQAHDWIDDTDYADHGRRRYVCATCGATRTEPYDTEE